MTVARIPPSGEQVDLRYDGHHAVIVEVSGGIRSYEVNGRPLLDGYAAREMCTGARGHLLVPWPNRLRDGAYQFEGQTYQVPISEPAQMNAIHGLLRWESWRVAERENDRVVMEHTLHPRDGYPFALQMGVEYRVGAAGLSSTVTATNVGGRNCPYGMGAHPYLRVSADTLDPCWLEAPGRTRVLADARGIPVGVEEVEGSGYDFRTSRRVLGLELDSAFTDLKREDDGRAWVRLWNGPRDEGVGLWMDKQFRFYMLYSGDSLSEVARRRQSLAVEPMTCAPNAFASGDGLITLAPGDTVVGRWGVGPLEFADDPLRQAADG